MSTERLVHHTMKHEVSIEMSSTHDKIGVFIESEIAAEFRIEEVWDMLKDALATVKIDTPRPGLLRRKREALAGIAYTKILLVED